MSGVSKGKRGYCRCGHPWSQHIGQYGDGFVICAGPKCKCAYQAIVVTVRRVYGVRKEALAARRKHDKSEAFYLSMAVENELARRKKKG